MSNIASYPLITPKGGDLIIGSETYDATLANPVKGNPTRNFSVSSVVSTQIPSYIVGTTNKIPVFTGSNKIQDSIMTETAAGGSFTGKYISISAAGGGLSTQKLEVNKALIDGAGSTGTDGFLLSSTTVGGDKEVAWFNPSSIGTLIGDLNFNSLNPKITLGNGTTTGVGTIRNSDESSSIELYGYAAAGGQNFNGELHVKSKSEMNFFTNNTIRMFIEETGDVVLDNGSDLRIPSGAGIFFNGQTSDLYQLDNYQKGTFTPLLGGEWASNPSSITGKFTRIGNKVTINIKWQGGSKADITTGYFKVLPTIPLAGELFVGSVSGANFLNFGVATISPGSTAADSAIYLSNNDFDTPTQNHFATITYLMAT